jgi:2-amino-4-hydroxy-6-hydroxymethyldihydropteridine diphosphokinase
VSCLPSSALPRVPTGGSWGQFLGLFTRPAAWFHPPVTPSSDAPEPEATSSSTSSLVVIGLGANLGDPRAQLGRAALALRTELGPVLASSLYVSEPIGPEQPDFMNAALLVSHPAPLADLLRLTRRIEHELGRRRETHWGPRLIDLDLLWAGERTASDADLCVPHPELTRRAFALRPLLDLCPDAVVPAAGVPYRSFLAGVRSQRIRSVSGPEWCPATQAGP